MLTLSEAWKASYSQYLQETENSLDDTLTELLEATKEINKGFDYIQEYFKMVPLQEEDENKKDDKADNKDKPKEKKEKDVNPQDITNFLMRQLGQKILDNEKEKEKDLPEYNVEAISTVQTLSDMKFPKNIIFFIQQLVAWIQRVVVYFIEKIKNVFRAIFNQPIKELDPNALKLKLKKSRELETVVKPVMKDGKVTPVRVLGVKADDVKRYYALQESFEAIDEDFFDAAKAVIAKKSDPEENYKKNPVVISIDVSKDLMHLKELIQHFYDLYDNAFGSNNEDMFKTDDLEMVLSLFKDTVEGMKRGDTPVYEIGSTAVEVAAIDSSRVRDNLIRTNTNITALKEAYMQTSEMIKSISRVITHKELLMLSGYGVDSKWLSSATYEQMHEIVSTMKPRLKEAQKSEKALSKMQKKYEEVASDLIKLQRAFNAFANVTYSSVYQKRVVDMCQAAKYMSQVVTLRLTAIGMYIKEMKDIKDLLVALSNVSKTK